VSKNYPFWPRIDFVRERLTTVVDSMVIVFFLDRDKCVDSAPAEEAFAEFFSGIGHNKLHFYVDEEGYTAPLPPDPMVLVRQNVVEKTRTGELVDLVLLGTEQSGNRYQVQYLYDPTTLQAERPHEKSVIRFRIAQDVLLDGGLNEVLSFVDRLSGFLPYSYGYVSPALSYSHFFSDTLRYIYRYPGFDVVHPGAVASDLDDRILGPYWVNIFGPRSNIMLNGADALRRVLPNEVQVSSCGGGGARVVLGDVPDVGDVNRRNNLPLYRAVASIFRPYMRVPEIIYFKDEHGMADKAAQEAWHNRFF